MKNFQDHWSENILLKKQYIVVATGQLLVSSQMLNAKYEFNILEIGLIPLDLCELYYRVSPLRVLKLYICIGTALKYIMLPSKFPV